MKKFTQYWNQEFIKNTNQFLNEYSGKYDLLIKDYQILVKKVIE
jgi:hypothetical protein